MKYLFSRSSRAILLTPPLLLLLLAQSGPAQTTSAAAAPPAAADLTVRRPLPVNDATRNLRLPPEQVTITIPGALLSHSRNEPGNVYRVDATKVRLVIEPVNVSTYAELLEQLKENNLAPTPDLIGLILDLNPSVSRLDSLAPKTKLLLPEVEGDKVLERAATIQPFTLLLDSAAAQRELLRREQVETRDLSARIAATDPGRFGGQQQKTRVKVALDSAENSLKVIGDEKVALSRRVREQTQFEINALQAIASEALSAGGGIAPDKLQAAESISGAMAKRSADVNSGGSGTAPVEVHTLKRSDGTEVKNKRVVCKAAYGSKMFVYGNPSTPTTEALPLSGEYVCWASEGEPYTPISDKVPVTVQEKNTVKLRLPPPPGGDQ